jgi:hypothetical protein
MEKKTLHRLVGGCGVVILTLLLIGLSRLAWWFLAPIFWKFASGSVTLPAERDIRTLLMR